jgi:hypothetical protein
VTIRGRGLVLSMLLVATGCGSSTDGATEPEPDAGGDTARADTATTTDGALADSSTPSDTARIPEGSVVDSPASDAPIASDTVPGADLDLDGIDDAREDEWAIAYLPYISVHPSDGCPVHGVIVRVAPHPKESKRVMLWYDILWDEDCGASGHEGDDEMFGVVIDPTKPAPDGILAERTISHQNTPCEHVTTCGRCSGLTACTTAKRLGKDYPTVFPSKDKHGNYADQASCSASFICDFGGCAPSTAPDAPPIVNIGEPTHPRVTNLTTQAFITATNGWKSAVLMNFDPWKPGNFGGAGDVSKDMVDPAFVVDTTRCP